MAEKAHALLGYWGKVRGPRMHQEGVQEDDVTGLTRKLYHIEINTCI
jgi:hypothetical protein